MSTDLGLPRVVELVRVSTDMQREKATHEVQRQALDALRAQRPGVLVRRLEALGVSGAKGVADRDDLKQLEQLSRTRSYDELRVFSIDRLTRSDDPRERAAIYGMVLDAGAKIVDINGRVIDPSKDGDLGELDYFLQTLFSARERKKIGARTLAGRKLRASQGKLSQGLAPYGRVLNRTTMTWELVPPEVEVYRGIIDAALAGRSTREIAAALNASGTPSRVRGRWGKSTIIRLLSNPAIIGRYEACGHVTLIPPVATEAEWGRLRVMLQSNASAPNGQPIEAALRGRLVCASCGLVCHVDSDGKGWVVYSCPKPSRREGRPPCPDRRAVSVDDADFAVRDRLEKAFRDDPEGLELLQGVKRQVEDPTAELRRLDKRASELVNEEARVLRLVNKGSLSEEAADADFRRIKFERVEIDARREVLSRAPKPVPVEETLSAYKRLQAELTEPGGVKQVLSQIVPATGEYGLWLTAQGVKLKCSVFSVEWELIAPC